jgi:hypothetical protein
LLRSCSAYDPRQYAPKVHPSTQMLEGGVRGLKVALVREGFSHSQSEPDGDEKERKAADSPAGRGQSCVEALRWKDYQSVSKLSHVRGGRTPH